MTDEGMTRRERWAAADAARGDQMQGYSGWGMTYENEDRDVYAQARTAYARGDRWFQVDIPVSYVMGRAYMGATATFTQRRDDGDVIGGIEAEGWRLEHVAATYVLRGHGTTKRLQVALQTNADDHAYHGELVGLYVFRRAES